MEHTPTFLSVTQISERTGIPRTYILDFCNARAQKFAFKPKGGKFLIDIDKFIEYLERRIRNEQRS